MKDIVRLKSYPNGIRIVIAEDALLEMFWQKSPKNLKIPNAFSEKQNWRSPLKAGKIRRKRKMPS